MLRALIAGLLAVAATTVAGTWVVLRSMSFLSDALSHGVLPGIAVAWIIGADPLIGAFIAALIMIMSQQVIRTYSPLSDDTTIGLLFVGFLSLAVVIMSSSSGAYAGDLTRFLFGSITGVTRSDLIRQAIATSIVVVVLALTHRSMVALTFDPVQARLMGLRPRIAQMVLLAMMAMAVVSSFTVVGNLLVFAFMIAPPAAATLVATRVFWVMTIAALLGTVSVIFGLLISYHYRSAAGATMALISVAIFLILLLVKTVTQHWRTKTTQLI